MKPNQNAPVFRHNRASSAFPLCTVVALVHVAWAGGQASACGAYPKWDEEKVAADLANPLAPITSFASQLRTEFGNGPDDDVNYQLRLQPSLFAPIDAQSAFLLRSIVPISSKNWPTEASGLGDITLVPYYIPDLKQETFLGYGAAIGIPTATDDGLGSEKWTAGPATLLANISETDLVSPFSVEG